MSMANGASKPYFNLELDAATSMGNEPGFPQGFQGTREHGKKNCWEQGNKRKIKLGIQEQKMCRSLGNKGKQRKFC